MIQFCILSPSSRLPSPVRPYCVAHWAVDSGLVCPAKHYAVVDADVVAGGVWTRKDSEHFVDVSGQKVSQVGFAFVVVAFGHYFKHPERAQHLVHGYVRDALTQKCRHHNAEEEDRNRRIRGRVGPPENGAEGLGQRFALLSGFGGFLLR